MDRLDPHAGPRDGNRLLGTRYSRLANNTIDYWMLPPEEGLTSDNVLSALERAEVHDDASLQLYVHVPFCAQHCTFCAFSGANSLSFRQADRYATLLAWQIRDMMRRPRVYGKPIRSVHIGGGSPDLLRRHAGRVLDAIRELPGVGDHTEISVEFTLSTVRDEFLDELERAGVTKISFGIQTLDPELRVHMRQPRTLEHLEPVLRRVEGRFPLVNADLITCLPGQTLQGAEEDLRVLMSEKRINAISTYLLTPGASPAMTGGLLSGSLPPQAPPQEQALMRLNSYSILLREGWIRRGTNTYVNPDRMTPEEIDRTSGNECIGTSHYEAFLIGAGASAVSSVPGLRIEQTSALGAWCSAVEKGEYPLHLPACSTRDQRDTALWVFPLRYEGLPFDRYERMVAEGAITSAQVAAFDQRIREGFITQGSSGYELTLLGEVFMGQLVRDFKSPDGRAAIDRYIEEGHELGAEVARGALRVRNELNNRQLAEEHLSQAHEVEEEEAR